MIIMSILSFLIWVGVVFVHGFTPIILVGLGVSIALTTYTFIKIRGEIMEERETMHFFRSAWLETHESHIRRYVTLLTGETVYYDISDKNNKLSDMYKLTDVIYLGEGYPNSIKVEGTRERY